MTTSNVEMPGDDPASIYVSSEIAADMLTYNAVLTVMDHVWSLDYDAAIAHGVACLRAAIAAEYHSGVYRILAQSINANDHVLGQMVHMAVASKYDVDPSETFPLTLKPGMTVKDKDPVILVDVDRIGRLGVYDAMMLKKHAVSVLQVVMCVELDNHFYSFMHGYVQFAEGVARDMVSEIGQFISF